MPYSIIRADLEINRNEIINLWKRNLQGVPEERYPWIYEKNPSGKAICWLAKEEENKSVVGATALFPRRIHINKNVPAMRKNNNDGVLLGDKIFIAGIGGDFVVDKNHRILAPALLLQKAVIANIKKEKFNFLYSFPNKKSEAIIVRMGYKIIGEVRSLTKPLKSNYIIRKYFNSHIISPLVSNAVDIIMKCLSKEKYHMAYDKQLPEMPKLFDSRFDELWDRVSTLFPIIGERTKTYLNWRFIQSPHKEYRIYALKNKRYKNVLGYIIFHIYENKVYIEDFLFENMNEAFGTLISEFIKFARKEGYDSINIKYAGTKLVVNKLKEYGFFMRGAEGSIAIYAPSDSPLLPILLDEENWYLTSGDNDI